MAWSGAQREWRIQRVRRRDGFCCWLCGERFTKENTVTIDHAIPKARGGTNELHNLRLAHRKCNSVRGMIVQTPARAAQKRLAALRFPLPVLELTDDMRVSSAELQAAA